MVKIFDIFTQYNEVKSHKKAIIENTGTEIHVSYNGSLKSAGFRILVNTKPKQWYRICVNAKIVKGSICFLYCETNGERENDRLLERKYFITDSINEYRVPFVASTKETYVGILFYNCDQEYFLVVKEFYIKEDTPSSAPESQLERMKKSYRNIKENERSLSLIIEKNDALAKEMIREVTDVLQTQPDGETISIPQISIHNLGQTAEEIKFAEKLPIV